MFVTEPAAPTRLTPAQWLCAGAQPLGRRERQPPHARHRLRRGRPAVDQADPHGMLAVLLLRRIAYTLLTLYRAVTLRSDEGRATPWKALLRSVRDALVAATGALAGLRSREIAAATR